MELKIKGSVAKDIAENAGNVGMTPGDYLRHVLAKARKKQKKVEYLPTKAKADIALLVAYYGLETFDNPVVVWSGGKDSTLVLHFVKRAVEELGSDVPDALLIDHFMHYDETLDFMDEVADDWGFEWEAAGVPELEDYGHGDSVNVEDLPERLQAELDRIGYNKPKFEFALNNIAANHLLKTVAMKDAIEEGGIDAAMVGIRWDENPARGDETFFSPRASPDHFRIHPILPFTEKDVWEYTRRHGLPIHPLYEEGYRSLDDKYESKKVSDKPAWEQDFDETPERFGRAQDKENIMEMLRKFGYM